MKPYTVTIDGPGGSGKGTLALRVAKTLEFHLLDSGAIYRLAALKALQSGVDLDQEDKVVDALQNIDIRFETGEDLSIPFLDGRDVSAEIRQETTAEAASRIARFGKVRKQLLNYQQACFRPPGLVADGRDMGTVVFPNAKFKFYLYASVEVRVLRRYKQLIGMGMSVSIDELQREISERDERDLNRIESPLIPAPDAVIVDSSMLDLDQVTDLVMSHIDEAMNRPL